MSQIVRITLTSAEDGTGPFNLFSDVDDFYNPFEGNISLDALRAGYISTLVPDLATTIQVKSYNTICQTYLDIRIVAPSPSVTSTVTPSITATPTVTPSITVTPTTTPSITATPSLTPSPSSVINSGTLRYSYGSQDYPAGWSTPTVACSTGGTGGGQLVTVYWTGTLGNGTVLYYNSNLTVPFDIEGAEGYYYLNGYSFTYTGEVISYNACSHPISAGLVLDFDIDNTSSYPGTGGIVTNLYNSNQIFLINGPTYDAGPPASILLDGTNDYMITSNYTDVQLGVSMSYETIIEVGTGGLNNGNFYAKNYNDGLRMRVKSTGEVEVINTVGNIFTTSGAGLVENTKYHVVFTGGPTGTGCEIYVNGTSFGTTATAFVSYAGSAGIYFGVGNGTLEPLKGNIYLGRQYDRTLSSTDVTNAYNYYQSKYNL